MKALDWVETSEKTNSYFWLVWLPDHISMQEPSHAEVLQHFSYNYKTNINCDEPQNPANGDKVTTVEVVWETPAATSVTLGSNFLEIKTEPVNLMNSDQGVIQIVVMNAMAWVIIIYDRHLQFCTSLKCNT